MSSVTLFPYHEQLPSFYHERVHNLFYSPEWISVLERTYEFSFFTALDPTTDHLLIVALVDNPVTQKIISLPFSDYTDLDPEAALPLLEVVREAYPSLPLILKTNVDKNQVAAKDHPLLNNPTRQAYYHRVDTQDATAAVERFSSSFRRGIKKAKRSEVTVEGLTDETAMQTFYSLFYQLRLHKFESIPQPYAFFRQVWETFIKPQQGFVLQASRRGEVIAAIVVLQYQNVWYYKFGCSSLDSLEYRPNNLLFAELIRQASEHPDITAIDLGLSGAGASYEGLVRFKESMGGERLPITYYEHLPEGYDPAPEKAWKATLSSLTQIIVKNELDLDVTDQFSEIIYPYFA